MFIDDPLEIDSQLAKEKKTRNLGGHQNHGPLSLSIAIEYVWRDIT